MSLILLCGLYYGARNFLQICRINFGSHMKATALFGTDMELGAKSGFKRSAGPIFAAERTERRKSFMRSQKSMVESRKPPEPGTARSTFRS